jgi:hypothetical protein
MKVTAEKHMSVAGSDDALYGPNTKQQHYLILLQMFFHHQTFTFHLSLFRNTNVYFPKDTVRRRNIVTALTTVISDWTTHSWLVNRSTAFHMQCAFLHDTSRLVTDAVAEFTWLTRISWYLKEIGAHSLSILK